MLNLTTRVLQKDGQVIENTYQTVAEDGQVPNGDVLLSLQQLNLLAQIKGKKAVLLGVEDSPEQVELPLAELDSIFIAFPAFTDGRGYSYAALLRRQGFKGELRAVGDVFKDVLNYLMRSGFDSFVLKAEHDIEIAARGLKDFEHPYQYSVAKPQAEYQTGL
ncbi:MULTISPECIES: DUF934 domain-containing protein [unclassified Acinetobacter]|uniref:DUF934 domain-containing protein n=1 Tax=unclassified Acinetobacter TaxID=196816 RepID=UPI0035B9E4C7